MANDLQIADTAAAWASWVEMVPAEERMVLATEIAKYDTSTFEGLARLQTSLLAMLISGKVSTAVVTTAMPLLKELQTTLFMIHKYQEQGPMVAGAMMRQVTTELMTAVKPVSGRFITSNREQLELGSGVDGSVEVPSVSIEDDE